MGWLPSGIPQSHHKTTTTKEEQRDSKSTAKVQQKNVTYTLQKQHKVSTKLAQNNKTKVRQNHDGYLEILEA